MMRAFALKVVSEKIWNNVLASDFVSVLFISILSKRIHAVGYDGQMQGSNSRQGQGYVGLAIGIYQPNHISSSFVRR